MLVLTVASFFIAGVGLLSMQAYRRMNFAGIEEYWGPLLFALSGAAVLIALFISLIIRQARQDRDTH
ncbi:hypothetical protein [Fodinicurvata halophila]|uniref:hypothetical protein n=1 Tax=Fodinicurvata halophila TaxID=1419723 RepID=UPI003636FB3A